MTDFPASTPMDLDAYKADRVKQIQSQHLIEDDERKRQEAQNKWYGFITIAFWKVD